VWNHFKEDTESECNLCIKGVVYEPGGGLILMRIEPVGISLIRTPGRNVF